MSLLPTLTAKQIMKILEANGCRLYKVKGSHHHFICPFGITTVPVHSKEIKLGLLNAIIKQSGIEKSKFIK